MKTHQPIISYLIGNWEQTISKQKGFNDVFWISFAVVLCFWSAKQKRTGVQIVLGNYFILLLFWSISFAAVAGHHLLIVMCIIIGHHHSLVNLRWRIFCTKFFLEGIWIIDLWWVVFFKFYSNFCLKYLLRTKKNDERFSE